MGLFSYFRRKPEPDFETVLSTLSTQIATKESSLHSIQLRERRANALFITYGVGAWVVYFALWWFGLVGGAEGLERALGGVGVVAGPVGIVFTRRILRWWYDRKKSVEEATLKALKKQQRDKVEELKRKTGYYSTRNLLEKYDEVVKKNAETRGFPPGTPIAPGSTPSTPMRKNQSAGVPSTPSTPQNPNARPSSDPSTPATPYLLQQQQQLQQRGAAVPYTPPPRTVFDKLADALLGVSGAEEGPNNKYALICGQCYAHNGLVLKEEFETIQYKCPHCGFLNRRRKELGHDSLGVGLREGGGGGHRRRVHSMHVSSGLSRSFSDDGEATAEVDKADQPTQDDVDAAEVEDIVLKDSKGKEEQLRKRRAKVGDGEGEAMEVDT